MHKALWSCNLISNRVHFSPEWGRLVGCDEHELGNTPQIWLQRVHPEDVGQVSSTLDALRPTPRASSKSATGCVAVTGPIGGHCAAAWSNGTARREAVRDQCLPYRRHCGHRVGSDHGPTQPPAARGAPDTFHRARKPLPWLSLQRFFAWTSDSQQDARRDTRAGDAVLLSAAARRLETSLRTQDVHPTMRNDDVVARLEQDVFAILLDGLKELATRRSRPDRILTQMLAPFAVGGHEVRLSPSIGIAVSATGHGKARRRGARRRHRAASRLPALGPGPVRGVRCRGPAVGAGRTAAGDRLRRRSNEEFRPLYQPIVPTTNQMRRPGEALGCSGSIQSSDWWPRRLHRHRGTNGIHRAAQRWVLRRSVSQLKAWHESVPPPPTCRCPSTC